MALGSDSEKIGRLLEAVERLTEEVREERNAARENRATIHRRLDGQGEEIAKLRQDILVAAHIDAQVRNELSELRDTVEKNQKEVMPDVEEFRRMRRIGRGIFWLLGLGGISIGAAFMWAADMVRSGVVHWLKVN